MSGVIGFFDKDKFNFNPFIASGAIGMCIDEFNGDKFDHGPHGFVGGGYLGQVQTNGRPIETTPVPEGTPKWGAKWKRAVADYYLSSIKAGSIHGSFYSYRDVYLDLDTFDIRPGWLVLAAGLAVVVLDMVRSRLRKPRARAPVPAKPMREPA